MKKCFVLAFSLFWVGSISAQTTTHLVRGGEGDPGATAGASLAASTTDFITSSSLVHLGGASDTYVSVGVGATANGSTLAFNIPIGASGGGFAGAVDLSLTRTSSFVMDLWVNTSTAQNNRVIMFNGDSTLVTGIGLTMNGNNWGATYGNMTFSPVTITSGSITDSLWHHIAVVFDNGNLSTYQDGSLITSTGSVSFQNPTVSDYFMISGSHSGYIGDHFIGEIDEARIFTFATGTFNVSMLSASPIPEPSTYAAILGLVAIGFVARKRRRIAS